jgi:hypothetical protein
MIAFVLACAGSPSVETPNTSFVDPWADSASPASCDVVQQDCPSGQKCVVAYRDTPADDYREWCVDVHGKSPEGAACTSYADGSDDCAVGLWCWTVCRHFCDSSCASAGLPDDTCLQAFPTGESLCVPPCDPLASYACGFGMNCILTDNDFSCVPTYAVVPSYGSPCTQSNECAPGYACAGGGCRPYCDLSASDPGCPNGTTCQASGGATSGDVGVCR